MINIIHDYFALAHAHYTGSRAEGLSLPGSDDDYMFDINDAFGVLVKQSTRDTHDETAPNILHLCIENAPQGFAMLRFDTQFNFSLLLLWAKRINGVPYASSSEVHCSYTNGLFTRTLALLWMRVTSMPDGGQRMKRSKLTLFRSGSSRSPIERRIRRLKHSVNTRHESIFSDPGVVRELPRLHENSVIVPADKASNNYIFVCKRHYVRILTEELGLNSIPGNPTYKLTDFSASEVLDNHKSVLTSFGIETCDDELELSYIYWIPKTYKNPYKHRFIAGSSKCSIKPLSILLTKLLTHILSKVFRSTAKQPSTDVGSIRCGPLRIQRSYYNILNLQLSTMLQASNPLIFPLFIQPNLTRN